MGKAWVCAFYRENKKEAGPCGTTLATPSQLRTHSNLEHPRASGKWEMRHIPDGVPKSELPSKYI